MPAGTPGFTVSKKYSKVGWMASDTRELSFVDCRVPEANLLGERGRGYAQFLRTLDEGRIAIAALSVGLAQGCIDESLRYVGRAGGLRAQDRRVPGAAVQAGGHGGADPRGPPGLLRRGGPAAGGPAVQEGGGHRQAGQPPTQPWSTPGRRPRSSAATAS